MLYENCGILDRGVERGRSRGSQDYLKPQRTCIQAYLQISAITTYNNELHTIHYNIPPLLVL